MGGHNGVGAVTFHAAASWEDPLAEPGHLLVAEGCTLAPGPVFGQFTLTLNQPLDKRDMMAMLVFLGSSSLGYAWSLEHVSDTVKRLRFESGGDPASPGFSIVVAKGSGRR